MPDTQLDLWGNSHRAGHKPRTMRRYLIHDLILNNIWMCSAKNEDNAHALCNLNPDHTDIVCIGLKPVLKKPVCYGEYTNLWADK